MEAIRNLAAKTLPDSILYKFGGTAEAFKTSLKSMTVLLIVAIVVIYMILGCLYESFLHPLTIISGLPSAAFGGLLTLWLFGLELNLYGFVGLFMLLGIVKKNAIMVVDFALDAQRVEGKTPLDAAVEGSVERFRPIMMTTIAAIAGMAPIAVGYGAGGESRQPLGLAVVGGLLLSQVVTLYLTPVLYTYLADAQQWFDNRGSNS
jgi:HAE1 family hydrophobic/amphiphilic exporter-1